MQHKRELIVAVLLIIFIGTACATSSAPPPARATDTIKRAQLTATSIVRVAHAQASATIIVGDAQTQVAQDFPSATPQPHTATPTPTPMPSTNTPTLEPTPTSPAAPAQVSVGNAVRGEELFNTFQVDAGFACVTCHLVDSDAQLIGPGLLNVAVRAETRVDGQSATDYLHTSIVDPAAFVVDSFPDGLMPQNWADIYTEEDINDIIAYLLTLTE